MTKDNYKEKDKISSSDFLKSVKTLQIAMGPMIATFNTISKTMEPTLKAIESMHSTILPIMKQIEAFQKSFIPLFEIIDFAKLGQRAKEMRTPAFKKFIKEWGWLVNKKSISFGDYCYGLYKKYGNKKFKDKINRWFYHRKNLKTVLKDIKSKYPERYHIIKEAFNFHAKRNYACSITLLLPQAEGILWDLGMKRNLVKRGYNSRKKKGNSGEWDLEEISKKLFLKDKFHNIIVKEIYAEGFRNKVLHGRNIYLKKQREISRWRSTLLILTLWRLTDEN